MEEERGTIQTADMRRDRGCYAVMWKIAPNQAVSGKIVRWKHFNRSLDEQKDHDPSTYETSI